MKYFHALLKKKQAFLSPRCNSGSKTLLSVEHLFLKETFVLGILCLAGNGKVNSCAAAEGSFTALTGLLEVEPLHFTCISTSDGTRVERDDASMFTGKHYFSYNLPVCG